MLKWQILFLISLGACSTKESENTTPSLETPVADEVPQDPTLTGDESSTIPESLHVDSDLDLNQIFSFQKLESCYDDDHNYILTLADGSQGIVNAKGETVEPFSSQEVLCPNNINGGTDDGTDDGTDKDSTSPDGSDPSPEVETITCWKTNHRIEINSKTGRGSLIDSTDKVMFSGKYLEMECPIDDAVWVKFKSSDTTTMEGLVDLSGKPIFPRAYDSITRTVSTHK